MADLTVADLTPWPWVIAPQDPDRICPNTSQILGLFAAVNAISGALAVVAGHRRVVKTLTCGILGHEDSGSWRYLWVLQVGLMLGANALNAWITVAAEGYDHERMPAIWDLMLFYTTRPRLNWIFFLIVIAVVKGRWRSFWIGAAKQTIIAEIFLQLAGLYYAGRTLRFAAERGYYLAGHLDGNPHKPDALLMYAAALLLIIYSFASTLLWSIVDYFENGNDENIIEYAVFGVAIVWMLHWLFISGYVSLSGELCVLRIPHSCPCCLPALCHVEELTNGARLDTARRTSACKALSG
jgi:hypothetical protein